MLCNACHAVQIPSVGRSASTEEFSFHEVSLEVDNLLSISTAKQKDAVWKQVVPLQDKQRHVGGVTARCQAGAAYKLLC